MLNRRQIRKSRSLALAGTAILACAGCGDRESEVRSYRVPKEEVAPPRIPIPEPPQAVSVASGPMLWELPKGWRAIQNQVQMRFATLVAGDGDQAVETSITRLGGAAGGIEANINRWRDQLGLPNATADEMNRDVHRVSARGSEGVWVDLIGPAPDGDGDAPRMFAAIFPTPTSIWFIKTVGMNAALEPHRAGFLSLCESVSFAAGPHAAGAAPLPSAVDASPPGGDESRGGGSEGTIPTWSALPAGWTADDTPKAMSVASITVSGGGQEGSLTITPLGGSQDLLANINRWRRQVGVGPIARLDEAPPVAVNIAGSPGQIIDIAGPSRGILGAVSVRGGTTWFYKLTGPGELIDQHRDAFGKFIRSIAFEGGDH